VDDLKRLVAIEEIKTLKARFVSVHHGCMPEIAITGDDTAQRIWSMVDRLRMEPGAPVMALAAARATPSCMRAASSPVRPSPGSWKRM
jgi:hypothetical protein